jgi:outer membrane protein
MLTYSSTPRKWRGMINEQERRFFMCIRIISLILTVYFMGLSGIVHGAEVPKIGVIDLQTVIEKSNAGKRSSVEIKSQGKKMEQVLKERGSEIEELRKTLDQKALVISDEARDEKENDLREKVKDLKSLQKRYQDVLRELNMNLSKEITEDVFKIVEEIGKKDGYSMIIDRRVGGIVYAPMAIDLTDKVIEQYDALDAQRSKEKGDSGEPKKEE